MAQTISHVANRGTGTVKTNNTSSWTVTTTGAVAAGNSLVVFHSYIPNSTNYMTQYATITGTGFPSLTTSWNDRSTSIASAMAVYYCPDGLASGTTLTITYYYSTAIATTTSAAAVSLHEFSGIANDTWESSNSTTGSSTTPSTNVTTVTSGNMVIGVVAVNGPSSDSFTQDTDTTNGSWVDVTTTGTTGAGATSNATVRGAWKITSASGSQTYDPTLGTSRTWSAVGASAQADPSSTVSGSINADAYVKTTMSSGSISADAEIVDLRPSWVSPADGTTISSTTPLVFSSVASSKAVHFDLQRDTANTFDTANIEDYKSFIDSGFEYWNGSSWVTVPTTGMPSAMTGNQVRFTPAYSATNGVVKYRRVRQSS